MPILPASSTCWLPAWTGNQPELLVSFYTEDAFYADPAVPDGVRSQDELLAYLRRLLARYPAWVWRQRRATPLEDGSSTTGSRRSRSAARSWRSRGALRGSAARSLIYRHDVFFDRSELLGATAGRG